VPVKRKCACNKRKVLESVEICTLGGVSHVLLSSLAHVGRFRHFVPSTLSIFTLTLVKVHFGHF
jgi:hypothetical protein